MLQVGIAGIGFMGMIHWLAYQRVRGVRVGAICSREKKKLGGDWRGIKGNFGPPGAKVDLTGVRTYERLDDMLGDRALDLVDICLPAKLHAQATAAALAAGRHVFCEKPIALRTADANTMLRAAASAKRQLLIGHVLPFLPEYAFALSAARSGKYGKLLGGHFKRVIADPLWIADYYDSKATGGPLVDLHIHDAHFIRLLFGMPTALFSRGRMRGEVVEYAQTQFICADPSQVVSATAGVIRQQGRAFNQAFEIHFERATLVYDYAVVDGPSRSRASPRRESRVSESPAYVTPLTVLNHNGGVERPELGSPDPADGFVEEVKEVVRSLNSGRPSTILSGELAADALHMCHKQTQSVKIGRLIRFLP